MKLVETYEFNGIGYQKLFHHENWRVAMLNYISELEPEHIEYVECHQKTDEVFVLLSGSFNLFLIEENNQIISKILSVPLETGKVYKIPAGIYHTHTLSPDAKLLIIEEEDTSYENSPRIYLTDAEKTLLLNKYKESAHAL
jgi:cupin superfamily acireductone dioxygenase involved in methionine salvage